MQHYNNAAACGNRNIIALPVLVKLHKLMPVFHARHFSYKSKKYDRRRNYFFSFHFQLLHKKMEHTKHCSSV